MHNSSCPKCGVSFNGDTKKCDSCGAVSRRPLSRKPRIASYPHIYIYLYIYAYTITLSHHIFLPILYLSQLKLRNPKN
ncbi:hypothetical protein F5Y00DRAFT_228648 [Daldinia vernicosa]|uniref:uncharacterized protein n=1 Tax=Daldinia vernicosa TaxID=114800 RepID=UPI0020074861|nr:uncharacterized protein F5Y00DRAFT_228648 [Daldinia vernicosa]KAI0852100.1 hypothetical protein F5Y00DRAFT_228648 [Daldinia vernicosa]